MPIIVWLAAGLSSAFVFRTASVLGCQKRYAARVPTHQHMEIFARTNVGKVPEKRCGCVILPYSSLPRRIRMACCISCNIHMRIKLTCVDKLNWIQMAEYVTCATLFCQNMLNTRHIYIVLSTFPINTFALNITPSFSNIIRRSASSFGILRTLQLSLSLSLISRWPIQRPTTSWYAAAWISSKM